MMSPQETAANLEYAIDDETVIAVHQELNIPEEVVRRYAYKRNLALDNSRERFLLLQTFLDTAAHRKLEPAKEIDDAWHEFILHTSLYRGYCEMRYGRIVEHVPTSPLLLADQLGIVVMNGDEGKDCSSDCSSEVYLANQ
jgi:hypothetical protein